MRDERRTLRTVSDDDDSVARRQRESFSVVCNHTTGCQGLSSNNKLRMRVLRDRGSSDYYHRPGIFWCGGGAR